LAFDIRRSGTVKKIAARCQQMLVQPLLVHMIELSDHYAYPAKSVRYHYVNFLVIQD